MKKKLMAVLLSAAMAATLLAGCGNSPDTAEQSQNTTEEPAKVEDSVTLVESADTASTEKRTSVTIGIPNACDSFDPVSSGSQGKTQVFTTVYQTLGEVNPETGEFEGVLMKDWESIDDTTTRVYLYDYITDQDGNKFTANDAKFVLDLNKASGNGGTAYIDEVTVVDDYTFDLKVTEPIDGKFEQICWSYYFFTEAAYEASEDNMEIDPVSTSAYMLTDYVAGSSYTFSKSPNYWQTEELNMPIYDANVDEIIFKVIPESSQMSIALETGEIDIAGDIEMTAAARFMEGGDEAGKFNVAKLTDTKTYFLTFNMSDSSIFKEDKALRQACLYAIDNDAIVAGSVSGAGIVCKTLGPYQHADFVDDWNNQDYYSYNLESAKQLLAESSYDGSTVEILTFQNEICKSICEIIQGYLLQIGVNSNITVVEQGVWNTQLADPAAWDININVMGSTLYESIIFSSMCDDRQYAYGAYGFVEDEELQALVEGCMNTNNHTAETLDAFFQYQKDLANCYGLFQPQIISVSAPDIEVRANFKNAIIPGACIYK